MEKLISEIWGVTQLLATRHKAHLPKLQPLRPELDLPTMEGWNAALRWV